MTRATGKIAGSCPPKVVAVCDIYMWYLLRRQQGLSREQSQRALTEMVTGVLG